ncbi:MAG: undecaprenyldiphospho-muramoylpentapeptide beta-N-acetylglucosaminyltransferase [Micrococcales bacterium]|nr:undecaprenyldiphospho-muramoylpentapeptide beta-N-acetylglucosaminyltransferase [Micrococcales bacterium]
MKVLLAGGGTAGHVNPLLATAAELVRRDPDARILALGTAEGLEARLVPEAGFELATIPKARLPRRPSREWLSLPGRFRAAVAGARRAIDQVDADVVVGFGGYVAAAAYVAARRVHCPIVVHEANARPGVANRLGARWASRIAVAIPGTPLSGAALTGLPLREAVARCADYPTRDAARAALDLDPDKPLILVTGGSLGAMRLNVTLAAAAPLLMAAGCQVLHLAGAGKLDVLSEAADLPGYHVLPYLEAMELAYAAADLLVSRAGAGTVCEAGAAGLPAVMVPLPHGNGEQRNNAAHLVEAGAAIVLDDADFTPDWVTDHLLPLALDAPRLGAMARAARRCGLSDGAARLATLIEEVAHGAR